MTKIVNTDRKDIVSNRSTPRKLLLIFLGVFFALSGAGIDQAQANPRYASIVLDSDTGAILHQRYANKKLHPASLTKVMTLLMVFDALQSGRLRMQDRIYISAYAASMQPSKLGLDPGEKITVSDAIKSLATKSANDIAVAVAEHLGGSERNFARMMTRRARNMNMKNTTFVNASGLHDKNQVSTARDMAIMARYVIRKYPDYYKFYAIKSFKYGGKTYRNHNRLMSSYPGMDGMKTGYINASGFNLIASAVRSDRRLIGVVFGGRTSSSRNAHMAKLLNQSFAKLPETRLAHAIIPSPSAKPAPELTLASAEPAGGAYDWAEENNESPIGQGDYDSHLSHRVEAGLLTIAAHTGAHDAVIKASVAPKKPLNLWSIQIGAFSSKKQSIEALRQAVKRLPSYYYKQAQPVIVPMDVAGGSLFRARLGGYAKPQDAYAACAYIQDCITIAP